MIKLYEASIRSDTGCVRSDGCDHFIYPIGWMIIRSVLCGNFHPIRMDEKPNEWICSVSKSLYLLVALRSLTKLDYFLSWNFGMMKTWILLHEMLKRIGSWLGNLRTIVIPSFLSQFFHFFFLFPVFSYKCFANIL